MSPVDNFTAIRLVVPLDPHTYDQLLAAAGRTRRTLEQEASARLTTAIRDLPDAGRALVVHGDVLDVLETILGSGSLLSPGDLLMKVERLAGISFLHCRLPFTPNQLEELERKAASQGWTLEQLVERTAPRIYDQFFDLMERSR